MKLGFGAAVDAIDVATGEDDESQRETKNSPSSLNDDNLGTENEKETNRSPANPHDCNFGSQASMADEFNGDRGRPRFNFFEFLTLAHKVVDSGDVAAMDALSDLKQKWELKYSRPARFPAKTARYVQPPVRRPVRCLLDETAEKNQPKNNSVAAAEISDSAVEISESAATFLAGKRPDDELGMTQKSQQ
ncbi:UNVERIFIED_CONTAM: hypothetical protein Sindi_0089700 [Sesamum indicum]